MKTIYTILPCIFCLLLLFDSCIINPASWICDSAAAAVSGNQPSMVKIVALTLLAVYEAVAHVIPSVGDYSAGSWAIKHLKKISDTLNVTELMKK